MNMKYWEVKRAIRAGRRLEISAKLNGEDGGCGFVEFSSDVLEEVLKDKRFGHFVWRIVSEKEAK